MLRKILVLIVLMTPLAACAPAVNTSPAQIQVQTMGAATYTDALGHKITLAAPAQRVVSLAPSNTEILFAIGAGSQVVGRDSYSDYPAETKQVPDIGGGFTVLNTELILSKKPDLVLAAPLTPPEQIADLDKAGLIVYELPNPTTFDDLFANIETIAKLTGHENEAATLIQALQGRISEVAGKLAQLTQKPLVYYELDGTDPSAPYAPGPDTFVDLLIRTAGGANFGADLTGEWVQVSVEQLLSKQPDLIVLGDNTYGGVTPEQVKARAGWEALHAVQQNKIFIFDDNLVSRPGPRLVDGLEAMAELLHPDLFK